MLTWMLGEMYQVLYKQLYSLFVHDDITDMWSEFFISKSVICPIQTEKAFQWDSSYIMHTELLPKHLLPLPYAHKLFFIV